MTNTLNMYGLHVYSPLLKGCAPRTQEVRPYSTHSHAYMLHYTLCQHSTHNILVPNRYTKIHHEKLNLCVNSQFQNSSRLHA